MSLPLIGYLLRSGRFGWTLYALGIIAYGVLMVASYPWLRDSPEVQAIFETYPRELLALFGVTGDYELAALPGYLASQYFAMIWVVILGAFVIAAGSATVAGEIERGTMALLLATPVSRWRLLLSKVAAHVLQLLGLVLATVAGLWLPAPFFDVAIGASLLVPVAVLGLAFFFAIGGYATLFSALSSDRGRAAMAAVSLTLAFYLLNVVASLNPSIDWLRNLTIFSLYDPQAAMAAGAVPWDDVALLVGIGAATYAAALLVFERRDCAVG